MVKIGVVGAGVAGLSTAVNIQRSIPGSEVTVIADKFHMDTTSAVAAGVVTRPWPHIYPGLPLDSLRKWLRDSLNHFSRLAMSEEAKESGVFHTSGYMFMKEKQKEPFGSDMVYGFRECTEKEMSLVSGRPYKCGWSFSTIVAECAIYLPYLMKKFRLNGGQVHHHKVSNMEELVGQYDLVVCCPGFGAKELLNDNKMIPVRGQIFRVKAPWIRHFYYTHDVDCYLLPQRDCVVVGGVRQTNNYSLERSEQDAKAIWQRAVESLPSLKNAQVVSEHVGLRPQRDPLRLEKEIMYFGTKKLPVVHNYGHGGWGISLSWGTALEATELVKQLLQEQRLISKL